MTTTVAAIAAKALDKVSGKISGVVKDCTLTHAAIGEFDPEAGFSPITATADEGRAFFDFSTSKMLDMFPGFVIGPSEKLLYIEGLTELEPAESDSLTVNGDGYTILAAVDVMETGGLFAALVRSAPVFPTGQLDFSDADQSGNLLLLMV